MDYIAFDETLFNVEDFKKTIKQCPELKEISRVFINNYPVNISGTQRIYFKDHKISLTLIPNGINLLEKLLKCGLDNKVVGTNTRL